MAADGTPSGIDRALDRLIEAGLISILLLDETLTVVDRRGTLAQAVPAGMAIDEALPYLSGLAPDLLDLQDEPQAAFLLANVGLASSGQTEKVNIEAFWHPADRRYCLLLHRLGLRTEPETEIVKQVKSRRIAEQHLQQTRRDLNARQSLVASIEQSAPVALAVLDLDLNYRFATRTWRALFGLGPEPLTGRLASESPMVASFVNARCLAPALAGQTVHTDDAPCATGPIRWNAAPVLNGEGTTQSIVVMASSPAEMLAENTRLSHRVSLLEAQNRALDDFVATIAHDLEAPRRAIDRAVSTAGTESFAEIAGHSQRLRSLFADLLEHARAVAEPAICEPVDLHRSAEVALALTGQADAFRLACRQPMPPIVADRVALETILRNLIANSVRHHDRGAGHIEIDLVEEEADWRLAVTDDGPGIADCEGAPIFDPFRLPQRSSGEDGSGLGLALVATAVRRLGGSIRVGGRPDGGRGAVFTILWPKTPLSSA
jgi:signal transduction histidine kinase